MSNNSLNAETEIKAPTKQDHAENAEYYLALGAQYKTCDDASSALGALLAAQVAAESAEDAMGLAKVHERIGELHFDTGEFEDAYICLQTSLTIRKNFVASDADNLLWQHDLSAVQLKLGDYHMAQGEFDDAMAFYQASYRISEIVATKEPRNRQWQKYMSVPYIRMGDVMFARGVLKEAESTYAISLSILRELVKHDPENMEWQQDLAIAHNKMGDVFVASDVPGKALKHYQSALMIAEELVENDLTIREDTGFIPEEDTDQPGYLREVLVSCLRIADIVPTEGKDFLERSKKIALKMKAKNRLRDSDAFMLDEINERLSMH